MKKIRQVPGVVTEVLRHSRHDMLNQLQLVKGYMELGNHERVKEIIDEIVFDAHQETKLSNLKMPRTAELFMTFNWGVHHYKLEYEVLFERMDLTRSDDVVYKWCESFLQAVDVSADLFCENMLSITIDGNEEDACFIFDFSGKLKDGNEIQNYMGYSEGVDVHMYECSSEVFSIEMRVKR
ncbi:MAG: Spo0B C-terminal domain-containing protein [Bacilli bacterium]